MGTVGRYNVTRTAYDDVATVRRRRRRRRAQRPAGEHAMLFARPELAGGPICYYCRALVLSDGRVTSHRSAASDGPDETRDSLSDVRQRHDRAARARDSRVQAEA